MKKIFLVSLLLVAAASAVLLSYRTGGGEKVVSAAPAAPAANTPCAGDTASANPGSAKLTWDAIAAPNLAGYRIYYGTAPKKYSQPIGKGLEAGKNTNYTVSGLKSGTRYYFSVTGYDAAGVESPYSSEVCKDVR